jgi:N6-adenosine-specific RNA methylase IME4
VAPWQFGTLAMFGYDLIVADPPWDFENYSNAGTKKGADPHYGVMALKEIKALPVHELARGDCLLLLWTTGWAIATGQAQEVARAWGFKPISEIVWLKRYPSGKARIGTGYRVRTKHEPILVCTVGNPKHKPFPSTFDGIAREHSRKPDEFSRAEPYAAGNPARRSIQPADTSWVRRMGK